VDISEDAVGKISVVFFITVPDGSGSFATAGEAYQAYVEEGSYADSESPAPEPESQGGVQLASGDIDGTPIDRLTGDQWKDIGKASHGMFGELRDLNAQQFAEKFGVERMLKWNMGEQELLLNKPASGGSGAQLFRIVFDIDRIIGRGAG